MARGDERTAHVVGDSACGYLVELHNVEAPGDVAQAALVAGPGDAPLDEPLRRGTHYNLLVTTFALAIQGPRRADYPCRWQLMLTA